MSILNKTKSYINKDIRKKSFSKPTLTFAQP